MLRDALGRFATYEKAVPYPYATESFISDYRPHWEEVAQHRSRRTAKEYLRELERSFNSSPNVSFRIVARE